MTEIPIELQFEGSGLRCWTGEFRGVKILKQASEGPVAERRFGFTGERVSLDEGDWITVEEARKFLAEL